MMVLRTGPWCFATLAGALCLVEPIAAADLNGPGSGGSGKAAKPVHISVDLAQDLDRLKSRNEKQAVYNLFSRLAPPSPEDQPSGEISTKHPRVVRPRAHGLRGTEAVTKDPVVIASPSATAPAASVPTPLAMPPAPVMVVASPPPPPPPPPPKPPAVPFAYMGKLTEHNRTVYFLTKNDKLYTVKLGEDIDESYMLEGEAGNQIQLMYKPLRAAQTLSMIGP